MIPKHLIEVNTEEAVAEAIAEHRGYIRATARLLAPGDDALAADLEQEAAILLWKLDPTRFDASDRNYIRSALFKRMQQVARKERTASGGDKRLSLS